MSEPDAKPPAPKKGWFNPALRMMGIPRLSLPSRNWMIFWTVLAGIGGGIAYDRYEQKQVRVKYMLLVEQLSKETYSSERLPRKLTVFIAPPPDDFLDVSMSKFKRYIKPVLNSAAIDFDILVASKQGEIRAAVSDKIRRLRKEHIEPVPEQKQSWSEYISGKASQAKSVFSREEEPEVYKKPQELYSAQDVLGYYFKYEPLKPVRDDVSSETPGGIVCIGRGAYKEYIQGVHEGLLGPLEQPEPEKVELIQNEKIGAEKTETEKVQGDKIEPLGNVNETVGAENNEGSEAVKAESTEVPVTPAPSEPAEEASDEEKDKPPAPFISPQQYANAQLAPEFDYSTTIRDKDGVPVLFEQPLYVVPVPNVLGFTNIPKKIYNFFTRRYLAEDLSERAIHIVESKSRPFAYKDQYLAKEEEHLWLKAWVQKAHDNNSEWVQEMVVDERVTNRLKVID